MENKVLSIEQMNELNDLGIDTSKASLYWYATDDSEFVCFGTDIDKDLGDEICPTFSLQDILELLPSYKITYDKHTKCVDKYEITVDIPEGQHYIEHIARSSVSLLEAAFKMLKWCKRYNYL